MIKIIKNNLAIIILAFIGILICFANYTPGTILSGWDTLHPEFNFGLAIKREVFGVFRTYQGLGAVAAHSDMADLPRIIVLAILHYLLFLPLDFLRYSYIFLNLILGPIGMYFFLRYIFVISNGVRNPLLFRTANGISRRCVPRDDINIPSFLGALFYLLNLGTMQQFVVPFEMFTTQYASLPWLFLFANMYIYNKTHQKRTLLLFALVTLLSTPMAYAATLWYVYFVAFILYFGSLVFLTIHLRGVASQHLGGGRTDSSEVNTKRFPLVKKSLVLILLTLLINSFWILPNIYYVINHASQVAQANINKLFSYQAFLYNKEFGNVADISLLKSFLFDWNIYSGNNHFTQLLSPWIAHLKQPLVELLGFLFAGIIFSGIIYGIFRRNKILLSLLPLLFLCLFFFINDNFPTSYLYSIFTRKIPIFKEAFRFPQDKVLGIFTFVFAIYFAAGQFLITRLLTSIKRQEGWHAWKGSRQRARVIPKEYLAEHWREGQAGQDPDGTRLHCAQIFIVVFMLFYFMLPAFKGYLINPYMRVKIPKYYFEMLNWFKKQPQDARIAPLPINSFWGWEYHDWYGKSLPSFQGAGFIWFGIKQPLLARDFDRWSPYNEQYYREMSNAIYTQDPNALKLVLEKYNIKYILLDKSVIAPPNPSIVLLNPETQRLLEKQSYIEEIKEFGNTLFVYKIKSKKPDAMDILLNLPSIYPGSYAFYEDRAYKDYGNYLTAKGVYYPLTNLIDNQSKVLPGILNITAEGIVINLPYEQTFSFPSYLDTEDSLPSDLLVEKNRNQLSITLYPRLPISDLLDHPIPIVTKASLPKNQDIILSINRKYNFLLNNLPSNTPLSLGTINLATKDDNTIAIYPTTPNEEITPNLSAIQYSLDPCQDSGNQKIEGVELTKKNSFYIFGKDIDLCMTIPLSKLLPKDLTGREALLSVKFNYSSDLPLKFCVAKLINAACQNYISNGLFNVFGIQKEDIQNLALQFQLDTTKSNKIERAFYNDLTLNLSFPVYFSTLSNDMLKKSTKTINGGFLKTSSLIIPFSGNKQLSTNITKLPRTSEYCPNGILNNPPIIKKQILEESIGDFIRYISTDGFACDHFSYQNLSQNEAYLIAIASRNVKGLPMTICVSNSVSKHCDIYASLSPSLDFATDIFLLPPQIKNENGFDVNIGNLGIKKTPSINDLKSIEIIPFPYKWLTQIKQVSPKSTKTPNSVLILPQSFEEGWKAYEIKNYELGIMNWVNTSFPFILGKEIKSHVLVNNWENGWLLESQSSPPKADQPLAENLKTGQVKTYKTIEQFNNETIVTVFLPQYLEYLGFGLLIGTFAWLVYAYFRQILV